MWWLVFTEAGERSADTAVAHIFCVIQYTEPGERSADTAVAHIFCVIQYTEPGESLADTAVAHIFGVIQYTYCTGASFTYATLFRNTSIIQEEASRRGNIYVKARMRDTGKTKTAQGPHTRCGKNTQQYNV